MTQEDCKWLYIQPTKTYIIKLRKCLYKKKPMGWLSLGNRKMLKWVGGVLMGANVGLKSNNGWELKKDKSLMTMWLGEAEDLKWNLIGKEEMNLKNKG